MDTGSPSLQTILDSQDLSSELAALLANRMNEIQVNHSIVNLLRAAGSEPVLCEWLLGQPQMCRDRLYYMMDAHTWGFIERSL